MKYKVCKKRKLMKYKVGNKIQIKYRNTNQVTKCESSNEIRIK